jgi:DNA repair protein RecN (Recombination protein N)
MGKTVREVMTADAQCIGENETITDAAKRLAELDVSDEALAALAHRRDAAAERTARLAEQLSDARTAAARKLAAAVTAELAGLAMADARLRIEVRRRPAAGSPTLHVHGTAAAVGPDGADEVEFLLQPHRDAPALPIARAASGGELSRIMLALELSTGADAASAVPTMVFDEVDAGVGGRAAVEIGRRLARLARDRQVLVVTHLAQVAAYADRHVVVDRSGAGSGGRIVASDVRIATGEDRVAELARMLAGSDTGTAREHAAELLATAAKDREREPNL